MSWYEHDDARYYPFFDPSEQDFHIQYIAHKYQLNDYRGYPLSENGYKDEDDLHQAMLSAKLPPEVQAAYDDYKKVTGIQYRGMLD